MEIDTHADISNETPIHRKVNSCLSNQVSTDMRKPTIDIPN